MARLKARIANLTTTIDDMPDLLDFRLLESANLSFARLKSVLQEITNTFMNIKRPAQLSVAISLRRAIWTWITINSDEYQNVRSSKLRFDGLSDTLFDTLHSMADPTSSNSTARLNAFYPLMGILLSFNNEVFDRIVSEDSVSKSGAETLGRIYAFLNQIKKGLPTTRAGESCLLALADLTLLNSMGSRDSSLNTLCADMQADFQVSFEVTLHGILNQRHTCSAKR